MHFELRRDVGTVRFDGSFDRGDGRGDFTFEPDPGYTAALKKAGFGSPADEDLLALAVHDVTKTGMVELADRGYAKGGIDDLIAFAIHGVDKEFARELDPRWIKDMVESGPEDLDLDDLIGLKVQGVDAALIGPTTAAIRPCPAK